MPNYQEEMAAPLTSLTVRKLADIIGTPPDDVYMENKRVVCVFAPPIGAIIRFHLPTA